MLWPLQWGHAFSGVETSYSPRHSLHEGGTLQWGHAFSGVETASTQNETVRTLRRFNGATPFQAWRRRTVHSRRRRRCVASMGPRLFRRGDLYGDDVTRKDAESFNGATPFQAWRRSKQPGPNGAICRASMGPRLFRRGDAAHVKAHCYHCRASMGPRLFRRGDVSPLDESG